MSVAKEITLKSQIRYLKGVGEKQAELFAKLGIFTAGDLLNHRPRRWDDFSNVVTIAGLQPGRVTLKAQILEAKGRYTGYRGLHLTEALIQDETGYLRAVWFNQPYRAASLKTTEWYYLSGLYDLKYGRLQLLNPSVELATEDRKLNLIKPVYPTTLGLKSIQIQKAISGIEELLPRLKEILPAWLVAAAGLKPLPSAYKMLHFPQTIEQTQEAVSEFGMRELIALSLSSQILKIKRRQQKSESHSIKEKEIKEIVSRLDFRLTKQQESIVSAVLKEMSESQTTLNRLIQGDVGSGKTLIAALIAFNVIKNGFQVAVLAPTQILARQHFESLKEIYGSEPTKPRMEILTSALVAKERRRIMTAAAEHEIDLIIGTHALLSEALEFKKLALVIIDEQHRFGVEQRLKLLKKAEPALANVLTLSATPIPRSLALVLYADLDISLLLEKPPGRQEVETSVISLKDRAIRLKRILKTKGAKNQIYIVCPTIESLETEDSLSKIESYIKGLDPHLRYACLHARLPTEEKEKILAEFQQGGYEALISTSIIEAGLDIPDANTVVIMSPERFGLAQLHQLRGRVGRSRQRGYCYLCPFSNQPPSERLEALMKYQSGFKLSEIDLKLRGPGTLYGVRQSGVSTVLEGISVDSKMIKLAVSLAEEFISKGEDLNKFKSLKVAVDNYQQITHLN